MIRMGATIWFRRDESELAKKAALGSRQINPRWKQWARAKSNGKYIGREPQRVISAMGRLPQADIPPHLAEYAYGYWVAAYIPTSAKSLAPCNTYAPRSERFRVKFSLREHQKLALTGWNQRDCKTGGVIVSPCGSGKTMLGIYIAAMAQTNVLVLVNSNDLLEQWIQRIAAFTECKPARWTNKKQETGRITVATFQSLVRMTWFERWELGTKHGAIIVDECHRIPARTFAEVLASLPCRVRLGLTATPKRADGLGEWVNHFCGPTVYTVPHDQLVEAGGVLEPEIIKINTDITPSGDSWVDLVTSLTKNDTRNHQIARLTRMRVERGGTVLIITARREHTRALERMIPNSKAFNSDLSKRSRKEILQSVKDGITRVLIGTTAADEGLDLPILDTLILAAPVRDGAKTEQRVGRILRPHPKKLPPTVYDLVDKPGAFQGFFRSRRNLYKKLGWV